MNTITRTLCRLSLFLLMGLIMQACPIGGCPFPFPPIKSSSFVLGYRNRVDSLYCRFNIITPTTFPLSYMDPEPLFSINYIPSNNSSNDKPFIVLNFGYSPKENQRINDHHEDSPTQKSKLKTFSEKYDDVHFNRLVSGLTLRKTITHGRVVLEESLKSIKIYCNQTYAHYNAGVDLSEVFTLGYTDPVRVAKNNPEFSKNSAGNDYHFIEYHGSECDLHGEKVRFDKSKGMYKTRQPAPFQWYDGEYFPCVQYQDLSEVDFAEIPHISAMVALIPKVFPTVPGDYSFTIEVEFTNGKILRTTTPPIGFSGL